MIEDAEKGLLNPGGTIVEGTQEHWYGFSFSA